MTIFSVADHYTVWTKSTIIDILATFGDKDFQRSDTKEALIEHLEGYFVRDVIEAAELKALLLLSEVLGLLQSGRKYKRDKLVSMLISFQHDMKDKALLQLPNTPEDSLDFTNYVRIIFMTDPDLHVELETELRED